MLNEASGAKSSFWICNSIIMATFGMVLLLVVAITPEIQERSARFKFALTSSHLGRKILDPFKGSESGNTINCAASYYQGGQLSILKAKY